MAPFVVVIWLVLSLFPLLIPPPLLEFFREVLSISQHSLAQLFSHSYGRLYSQHAVIFNSLFSGLRDYYEKSGEGLDDTLADFWAQLLERAFPLLHPQYSFPPDFLLCLTRLTSTADGSLQPFGDSPRRLRLQVRRPHNLSDLTGISKIITPFCVRVTSDLMACILAFSDSDPRLKPWSPVPDQGLGHL